MTETVFQIRAPGCARRDLLAAERREPSGDGIWNFLSLPDGLRRTAFI
jgi:hypothetical protein